MIKLFKHLSLLTVSELTDKAVVFLLFIYMGRVFNPQEFGYLNYILAVASYFIIFIDLGLPQLATRELSSHRFLSSALLQMVSATKLFLFLFVMIGWIAFVLAIQKEHITLGLIMTLYLFSRVIDIFWYLQGRQDFIAIARIKLAKSFILLWAFAFLYFYPHVGGYLAILILALILPFGWYLYHSDLLDTLFDTKRLRFLWNNPWRIKVFLLKSMPLIASTFLILMYYNLDTVLIGYFMDLEAVARYNAAYKIVFAFIVVRSVFTSVIFPRMSEKKLKWNEGKQFLMIGIGVAVLIALIAYYFSEDLLWLAYGDKYITSSYVFVILSLTASVLWINLFFPTFFIAIKQEKFYMKVHIITAVINLTGNLTLIPRFGIEGAALATLIADVVSLIIFGFMYFRYRRIDSWNT